MDGVDERVQELERLEGLMKKLEMEEIPQNPWLDQLVFRKYAQLEQSVLKDRPRHGRKVAGEDRNGQKGAGNDSGGSEEADDDEKFYLHIEFPRFDHPIVFTDQEYPPPPISSFKLPGGSAAEVRLRPPPEVSFGPGINIDAAGYGDSDAGPLIRIYDPEVGLRNNPAEIKHNALIRGDRSAVMARDAKPNNKERDDLKVTPPRRIRLKRKALICM